jgi:murein DD-endopeptidase MepM/ murein hydrolase activator NlpD
MIFSEDNQVEKAWSVYGTRGGGHRGIDITTKGDKTIRSTVTGRIVYAGEVAENPNNKTWEWGYHIRIIDQAGNLHIFAHCDENVARLFVDIQPQTTYNNGIPINAGEPIATMGMSGNAKYEAARTDGKGNIIGQGPHVHYEVHAGGSTQGALLNPLLWAGIPNEVGSWYIP